MLYFPVFTIPNISNSILDNPEGVVDGQPLRLPLGEDIQLCLQLTGQVMIDVKH